MATLATPCTDMSRGRMVHRASSLRSCCESVLEVRPIFITRLSDECGDSSTGGCVTAGSRLCTWASRSCAICRARMRSVPSSKISTTDESPSTDLERTVFSHGNPLSAFSSGTVTSASTSSVESPGASVCTSASGGANSGKTSSGAFCTDRQPNTMSATAPASTSTRKRSEAATREESTVVISLCRNPVPSVR